MHFVNLVFIITITLGQEQVNYDYVSTGLIIANIKRRESIPLRTDSWWFNNNRLNYRRTKDIRQDLADRRFEITETQLREAQRETQLKNSQINDMREEEIKSQIREDVIRNEMQARNNQMRNPAMRNLEMRNPEIRNREMRNPEMTNLEMRNPEMRNLEMRNPDMRNLEVRNSDMRNLEMRNPEMRNLEMRNPEMRNSDMRNSEMRQNQFEESIRNNYNQMSSNYVDKDTNKLHREMKWLTIDTDDVPEI